MLKTWQQASLWGGCKKAGEEGRLACELPGRRRLAGKVKRTGFAGLFILLCALFPLASPLCAESDAERSAGPSVSLPPEPCMVVGFVGGFVAHDDLRHGPVQLAVRLHRIYRQRVLVSTFENRRRKQAEREIFAQLDRNHDGILGDDERRNACIVLFGHSWGAAAAVALARDLQKLQIPVMLTVQVDSVAKIGGNDSVIPANVADAVNFYQPHGLVHGRARIAAADPSRTRILGNFRMDYHQRPVVCGEARWYGRLFTKTHIESECDPQLWSKVESIIREHLSRAGAVDTPAEVSALTSLR